MILRMTALPSFKTSLTLYQSARRNNPEDSNLHLCFCCAHPNALDSVLLVWWQRNASPSWHRHTPRPVYPFCTRDFQRDRTAAHGRPIATPAPTASPIDLLSSVQSNWPRTSASQQRPMNIRSNLTLVQPRSTVQLYSVVTGYLKFNCYSMFKINKHRSNNYIFSIILFEFGYKILISSQSNSPRNPPATLMAVATWSWELLVL